MTLFRRTLAAFATAALLLAPARAGTASGGIEDHARLFVKLALALDHLDPHAIDAYYGPPALDTRKQAIPAEALQRSLTQLAAALDADPPSPRRDRLRARVASLIALVGLMRAPRSLSFDEEARRIYGVVPMPPDAAAQKAARRALDRLLPGRESLVSRVTAYRDRFVIPEDRRKAVFMKALAACRARTLAHWPLPAAEAVEVVWDAGVPAAWHRYRGGYRSLLQINPAAVADPGSALDVACHEAYPGHHSQFAMMEADAGHLPVEDTVVILRSPDQVLREGAANYGVDLAFPPRDRLAFTRDVLFPLAGFDRRQAATFVQVHRLVGELALSVMPVLRDYRDGKLASGDAMAALVLDAEVSSPEALLEFTRDMGAYVTGYTVARDLVRDCVAARSRATGQEAWTVLRAIVAKSDVTVLDPVAHPCGRTK